MGRNFDVTSCLGNRALGCGRIANAHKRKALCRLSLSHIASSVFFLFALAVRNFACTYGHIAYLF